LSEALFRQHEQATLPDGVERRSFPRIAAPFAVTVRGVDAAGQAFKESALACNMSACGLLVALERAVEPGSPVFVLINLWLGERRSERGLVLAARAMVLRCQRTVYGMHAQAPVFLTAVHFRRHRLLYRSSRIAPARQPLPTAIAVGQRAATPPWQP
jgi:hypothetical protein